jgi:hypothetical protein
MRVPDMSRRELLNRLEAALSSATATIVIALVFLVGLVDFVCKRVHLARSRHDTDVVPACDLRHKIKAGDTLASVSSQYFDDATYGWAILVATNLHAGSPPYGFVGTAARLPAGNSLCVPAREDADALREQYDAYLRAGHEAMLQGSPDASHQLEQLHPDATVTLVTWIYQNQIEKFEAAKQTKQAPKEIWATVVPHLKHFCRDYVERHDPEPAELAARLEQHLGLPPGSPPVLFVEFSVKIPKEPSRRRIFRPCADWKTDSAACEPTQVPDGLGAGEEGRADAAVVDGGSADGAAAAPDAGAEIADAGVASREAASELDPQSWFWFLRRYYSSYGLAEPYQYPWTAAGYTFDWAPNPDEPEQFEKWGESEFVVPKGAPIEVLSLTDTVTYCSSP